MSKTLKAIAVVVAIIAIGGSYMFPKVQTSVQQVLGAASGPDNTFECTSQNGLQFCRYRQPLRTATTTACAIKSPSATSTLTFASAQVTVASSTATTWTLAKATTAFATTTPFSSYSLSSGVKGTMVATSSTAVGVDGLSVLAPNTYIVWGVAGMSGSYDATKLAGSCEVEFTVN